MRSIALIGASGGIGAALVGALAARDDVGCIHATCYTSPAAASPDGVALGGSESDVRWSSLDATDDAAVATWFSTIDSLDWVINCVGMLHDVDAGPEKSIAGFETAHFERSMRINCLPTLLLGKHAYPLLKASTAGVFATVSARVGSIEDNRLGGWYSYRASKAALNMALKCLAIEWQRSAKAIRVAALHPGTTDTALSRPFQQNVPAGKLFAPERTAGYLLERIDSLHDMPSGQFIAWDGELIPW